MVNALLRGIPLLVLLLTVACPAWAQDPKGVGVVTALTGRAELRRPQAPQGQALRFRDNLYVRDVVDTEKESLARILLMGKATVTVRELSRFEIREQTLPDGGQRAVIDLAAGKIRVMVARRLMRPGDEVQIRTPNAIASVRGTDGIFEVATLPDGRPQTVVTGVEGEFDLALPRTAPFTAMAEVVSDAGSGILVAQVPPGGGPVRGLDRLQIVGAAGLQQVGRFVVSLQDVLRELRGFQGPSVGSGTGASNGRTSDNVINRGDQFAANQTTRSGDQPGLGGGPVGGGGGGSFVQPPVIQPTNFIKDIPQIQPTSCPSPCRVLVYDQPALATYLNGLGGRFQATSVTSAEFQTMTASQINGYRVLMVGSTDGLATGVAGLLNNPNVATAVTGKQVVTGLHTEHIPNLSGDKLANGNQFLVNALMFAGTRGTGLVAATDGCNVSSCVGGKAGQTWIDQTGSILKTAFTGVTITRGIDANTVVISSPTSPVNSGTGLNGGGSLTSAGLSNWSNSVHSDFSSAPAGYQVIQQVTVGVTNKDLTLVKP